MNATIHVNERWLPIPGYEGLYEVSDLGRVKSVARTYEDWQGGRRTLPERIMRQFTAPYDRRFVGLRGKGRKQKRMSVHRLVLMAFVGPLPEGRECCHNDGDASNNRLENLRYDTKAANIEDRNRHGRLPRGQAHPHAKITDEVARRIKAACAGGTMQKEVAARHGLNPKYINAIATGRTWRHI